MNSTDVYQAMLIVKQDAADTVSKLMSFSSLLMDIISHVEDCTTDQQRDEVVDWLDNDIQNNRELIDGRTFNIGNQLISLQYHPYGDLVYDEDQGRYFTLSKGNVKYAGFGWTKATDGRSRTRSTDPTWDDPTHFVVASFHTNGNVREKKRYPLSMAGNCDLMNEVLGNADFKFSLADIIGQFKSGIQFQNVLDDICSFIAGSVSFSGFAAKWQSFTDWTGNAKSAFQDFVINGSNDQDTAVGWLLNVFNKTSTVEEEDNELSFSPTDFSVSLCWTTILSGIGNVISVLVQAVGAVLTGVARAVGAIAVLGFTVFQKIFESAANPLLTVNDKARQTLQVPIAQLTVNDNDYWSFKDFGACTMDMPFLTWRYWFDDSNNQGLGELFLRPLLTPKNIAVIHGTSSALTGYRGIPGLQTLLSRWNSCPDDTKLLCGPQACISEYGQAICVAANLYVLLCVMGDMSNIDTSFYTDGDTDNVSKYWDRIRDTNMTVTQRMAGVYGILRRCWHVCKISVDVLYKDNSTVASMIGSTIMSWAKLCNEVIPLIRSYWTSTPTAFGAPDLTEVKQNQNLSKYVNSDITFEIGAPLAKTYGIATPKNTSEGFIFGLVATIAIATVVAVATVVVTTQVKKRIKQKQLKMSLECENAKKAYYNSVNGVDNDDPTGSTSRAYTKEEQSEYFKKYYKSVRSYNRMSILFGGETFNMVNGWTDAPASSTTPVAATDSPLSKTFDQLMSVASPSTGKTYNINDIISLIIGNPS